MLGPISILSLDQGKQPMSTEDDFYQRYAGPPCRCEDDPLAEGPGTLAAILRLVLTLLPRKPA